MREIPLTDVETNPFFFRGGHVGCLLIHGFTATPQEMRFLGTRLHARGFTASGVRLAGHATSLDDFERCTWRDWYASACDGLAELHTQVGPIVAVGQSMGALLALMLAVDFPDAVAGLALLSPALTLSNRGLRWATPVLPLLPRISPRWRYIQKGPRDVADAQAGADSPSYPQIPLRALHQLLMLQTHVRRLLPQVRQPVLVIHSQQDHTCPVANVAMLQQRLRGPLRVVLLEASYHVISIDLDKERVAGDIAAFAASTTGTEDQPFSDSQPRTSKNRRNARLSSETGGR